MRSGWLKKGIDALDADPGVFTSDEALVVLGVGKNMVTSIRHWLIVTRMAEETVVGGTRRMRPTELGTLIFGDRHEMGWDSFFEDDATLWLLHWQLAGPGSLAFTWAWTFNHFREYQFTKEELANAVVGGTNGRIGKPPSQETIGRDVECLLHTYVTPETASATDDALDCPLQGLGLLRAGYDKQYRFQFGPKPSLPGRLFYYALDKYWEWKHPNAVTVALRDICYDEGSPGLVFKIDEDTVMEYLDGIHLASNGTYTFEDTGLIREVVRDCSRQIEAYGLLREHYLA